MAIVREPNYSGPSPLLYLIATPIGNLSEWSPRAIEVLKGVDFVACEDTRNSKKLLSLFDISKTLISCHEHNEEEAGEKIISLLKSGKKVAYMSDAGYPCVSDPGERLVRKCIENGIKIATINGPSAGICALTASGLDCAHYYFQGFLSSKPSLRKSELQELSERKETIVFYESPHRIGDTLKAMASILGEDRKACLGRELTKAHEEFIRGTLGELSSIDPDTLIGEMVIVVEGSKAEAKKHSDEEISAALNESLKTMKSKDAIAYVSSTYGIKKNRVYDLYLKAK